MKIIIENISRKALGSYDVNAEITHNDETNKDFILIQLSDKRIMRYGIKENDAQKLKDLLIKCTVKDETLLIKTENGQIISSFEIMPSDLDMISEQEAKSADACIPGHQKKKIEDMNDAIEETMEEMS